MNSDLIFDVGEKLRKQEQFYMDLILLGNQLAYSIRSAETAPTINMKIAIENWERLLNEIENDR